MGGKPEPVMSSWRIAREADLIYSAGAIVCIARLFMELNNDEIRRYSRHLILPEVRLSGQKKICSASVLCIGAGGLRSPIAMYLAAAGVGNLGLLHFDSVAFSNHQRHIIHGTPDVGRPTTHPASH